MSVGLQEGALIVTRSGAALKLVRTEGVAVVNGEAARGQVLIQADLGPVLDDEVSLGLSVSNFITVP
jgi:hypothetical protein